MRSAIRLIRVEMLTIVVTALLIIAAASEATTPRLRESDLRGLSTRRSDAIEPERVAGYFRLNRTHAGEPCRCCGEPQSSA